MLKTVAARGRDETILVVEDDPLVRELARRILERAGYRVVVERDGFKALDLARSNPQVEMVFTDVILPKMKGRELAVQLVAEHPSMKILFSSGYAADVIGRHSVLDEGFS